MPKTPWTVGDNPKHHPLYKEQIKLEFEMVQLGVEHFREMVASARDPGMRKNKHGKYPPEMTRVITYRREMADIVSQMGEALKVWLQNSARARGPKHHAYHLICDMDPYVTAFITVRTIMDSASIKKLGLYGVARSIGLTLEQEYRMYAWIAEEPGLWKEIQDGLRKQKATDEHKERVNVNRFNKLVAEKIGWTNWTTEQRTNAGLKLIDLLCKVTNKIVVEDGPPNHHGRPQMVVGLSEDFKDHIAKALDRDEERQPHYLPTIIPPKRWEGVRNGGYYSKFLRVPWLIRFRADNEESQGIAADEYDTLEMPRVFEAVRLVQETPWRINQRVLAVAHEVWERDLGIAGFNRREEKPLPPRPKGFDKADKLLKDFKETDAYKELDQEEWPEHIKKAWQIVTPWRRTAAEIYGENARRVSSTQATRKTLWIADKFSKREFYFPHMLDFRGRMYPIPVYLNPQGHDLARGLLTFANGKPVSKEDAGWLAIQLANTWGFDKASFDDRMAWVDEREDLWRAIAEAPMQNLQWTQCGDPWQALASAFEWARWLVEGEGMISSLPIRVDGTCNGIQHLSAMMRDPVGGAEVNLIPGQEPKDIYGEVGRRLAVRLQGIAGAGGQPGQWAQMWLDGLGGAIPRSLTKNPVMVMPYGGTRDSYFGSIHKWLRENDPEGAIIKKEDRATLVPFLRDQLWEAVEDVVVQGKKCMEWLKEVAEVVAQTGQPIFWSTPTGFHVRHFYGKLVSKQVSTHINGKRIQLRIANRTKELSKRDQLQGISPNFVHSMDASCNMETVIRFHAKNMQDPPCYTSIHDAYGTVAGQMWSLYHCIRESFVWVHSNDVLADFRDRCVLMYRDYLWAKDPNKTLELCWEIAEDAIKHVPERGNLDIKEVLNSDYFFA